MQRVPAGPPDDEPLPHQPVRDALGAGLVAGPPHGPGELGVGHLASGLHDLRLIVAYTFKQELEGLNVDDDTLNVSTSFAF